MIIGREGARPSAGGALVRMVASAVAVVLIAGVAWYVVNANSDDGQGSECDDRAAIEVSGLIGSEKKPFFDDSAVAARFACAGFTLRVEPAGSLDMVAVLKESAQRYDFAFPSSTPTAEEIKPTRKVEAQFTPFSSPMAVATFDSIVRVLRSAGIVRVNSDGTQVLNIAALLDAVRENTRWSDLGDAQSNNAVLLRTTDPRDSSSAIMFLSIVSSVANGNQIVTTRKQMRAVLPDVCRLILGQGTKPETSQVLFNQYLTDGPGRTPMALIYESQYRAEAPGQKPQLPKGHVLLFPQPTVYSRHTFLAFDAHATAVGRLLREDAELRRLAAAYGFRPEGMVSKFGQPTEVVEPPSYELLDSMLTEITRITQGDGECPR